MLNNSDSVSSCPDDKKAVRINADGTEEPILWLEIKIGDVIRSEDGKKKRVATEKTTLGQIATGRFHFVARSLHRRVLSGNAMGQRSNLSCITTESRHSHS